MIRGRIRPLPVQRSMEGEHEEGQRSTHRTDASGRWTQGRCRAPSLVVRQTQEAGLPYVPRRSQSLLGQAEKQGPTGKV